MQSRWNAEARKIVPHRYELKVRGEWCFVPEKLVNGCANFRWRLRRPDQSKALVGHQTVRRDYQVGWFV